MARTRGISEKIVWLYNPCPDVGEGELLARAKLDHIDAAVLSPFEIRWRYGGTGETEWVFLRPGDQHGVRESEGAEFLTEFGEQGMVLVPDRADADDARKIALDGLRKALKFWKDRGYKRVLEYRKKNALSSEDLEEYRYDLWAYFLNEEKANAVAAEIKRLQAGGQPVGYSEDTSPKPKNTQHKR